MVCPRCRKSFGPVQGICPDCYVELEHGGRTEFPSLESLPRPGVMYQAEPETPPEPEPAPEPSPEPEAAPLTRRVSVEEWRDQWTDQQAVASSRPRSGLTEWVLALLLLPVLWLMWSKLVQPLMAEANRPVQKAAGPAEKPELPAALNPDVVFANAEKAYTRGDYVTSASEADVALSTWKRQGADPLKIRRARLLMARSYARSGQTQQALSQYSQLTAGDPANPTYRSEAAALKRARDQEGRRKAAARLDDARNYYRNGDYGRADAAARQAMSLYQQFGGDNASRAAAQSLVGRSLYKLGNYRSAVPALKHALEMNPGDQAARAALADAREQIRLQAYGEPGPSVSYSEPDPWPVPSAPRPATAPRSSYPTYQPEQPSWNSRPSSSSGSSSSRPGKYRYNPNYSVKGSKYNPRQSEIPDEPSYSPPGGGLPSYSSGSRDNSLPNYSSGSSNRTLPSYDTKPG
ncbi:MAG: tetratricopeptide repeat protein, partial [Candidatus Eremiobacterota bacterium]